jgi:hypothetical protein
MERTELMVWEGGIRLRATHLSRHPPEVESRRVPDDRMLWKGIALKHFAQFSAIKFISFQCG